MTNKHAGIIDVLVELGWRVTFDFDRKYFWEATSGENTVRARSVPKLFDAWLDMKKSLIQ
jgi:hypothetical protein